MPLKKPELIEPPKIKMLLSGPAKTWKTKFALQWPATAYFDTEAGCKLPQYREDLIKHGGMYFGPEDGAQDFNLVLAEVKRLLTTKHDRKTLVIDSTSELEMIGIAKEEERLEAANKEAKFGAQKKPVIKHMRRLFNFIKSIDMNVILIAHRRDKWEGVDDSRKVVGSTYDGWDKIEYKIDLWCESKLVDNQGQMIVKGGRYKSFPTGRTIPMEYSVFAQLYGKEIIEKTPVPIVPATTEQLTEIKRLVAVLKLSDDELDKWMTTAQVEEIDDLSQLNAAKWLEDLNNKIKGATK